MPLTPLAAQLGAATLLPLAGRAVLAADCRAQAASGAAHGLPPARAAAQQGGCLSLLPCLLGRASWHGRAPLTAGSRMFSVAEQWEHRAVAGGTSAARSDGESRVLQGAEDPPLRQRMTRGRACKWLAGQKGITFLLLCCCTFSPLLAARRSLAPVPESLINASGDNPRGGIGQVKG